MYTIKRLTAYLFILLFIISLYKDVTSGTFVNHIDLPSNEIQDINFNIVTVSVEHGDTALSIIEKINNHAINIMNINDMLLDFKKVNPSVDPHNLKVNKKYNFPLYVE